MLVNHLSNQKDLFQISSGYAKKISKKKINQFKFIDLFAGIGGFRLGFEEKFFKCVFSSEWDEFAVKTYYENFKEKPFGDINDIEPNKIPDFHILTAGFPCQPFSSIGLRKGFEHKTQGTLFYNIAKILKVKKPICFVLENVPGLLTHKSGKLNTIDVITNTLQELGYEVNLDVLNSSDFKVPQIRKRVYLVGFLKKYFKRPTEFRFPNPKKEKVFVNSILEKNVNGYEISKHLQKTYIYKKDDGRPLVVNRNSKTLSKTLVSTYHKIQRLTSTSVEDGKTGLRLLTENECKKLMGFPDNFKIPVSRTQMYRQLGNAVVVPVVKELSKEVLKVLSNIYLIKK